MAGSELQRLVEVMNKLRSPGGCPWDAEQTHESLIKYLLEESYEFIDAVDSKDRAGMREELGDVLLQVYFHARMAEDHPTDPFSIEDVAREIADKLIRRHPHVFDGVAVSGTAEIIDNWEEIKAKEKGRTSALDGVALAQPALPLVEKLLYRAEKYKVNLDLEKYKSDVPATDTSVGAALASIIAWARDNEIDPENALRLFGRRLAEQIKEAESR
ncbi:MAG: MazG family protein [Candidatus Planktophila sp.]|tara:strand:- start:51 stop:695 length:645 start_codon:yes stop_codon:yes gene_type:complete